MNKLKTTSRKTKALETKKKIYDSASQLFRKYGFDNVSVDSIVEAAGVSKGTFYVHFESKNSLIGSLFSDSVLQVDLDYLSYRDTLPAGTKATDMLIMLGGKVADVISSSLGYDLMRIVYESLLSRSVGADNVLSYNRGIYTIFKKILEQGVVEGEFKAELDIDEVTRHIILGMRGVTYEWCVRYPDFDLKSNILSHLNLMLEGIKKA